jgi:hypothetical protein
LFLTHYSTRFNKVAFDARIDSDDLAHKVIDVIEAFLNAGAFLHVAGSGDSNPLDSMKDITTSHAWGFSILMCGARLLYFFRWLEIYREKETTESLGTSFQSMFEKLISAIFFFVAAVFSNSAWVGEISSKTAVTLWALTFFIERFTAIMLFIPCLRVYLPKSRRIPMHIPYMLHRFGEWVMLMIGESILSLVVGAKLDPTPTFYVVFCCGFATATFLQFIYYSTQVEFF